MMKRFITKGALYIFLMIVSLSFTPNLKAQENTEGTTEVTQKTVLETLQTDPLATQVEVLTRRTRIYENVRGVREDYFQLITANSVDSLNAEKEKNRILGSNVTRLKTTVDSLSNVLTTTYEELESLNKTKDSMYFLGKEVNKKAYNSIMWTVIFILLALLVFGAIAFKRNLVNTKNTKNEFEALQAEYEDYKQKTRIEKEKLNVEHFREIQRLKGK